MLALPSASTKQGQKQWVKAKASQSHKHKVFPMGKLAEPVGCQMECMSCQTGGKGISGLLFRNTCPYARIKVWRFFNHPSVVDYSTGTMTMQKTGGTQCLNVLIRNLPVFPSTPPALYYLLWPQMWLGLHIKCTCMDSAAKNAATSPNPQQPSASSTTCWKKQPPETAVWVKTKVFLFRRCLCDPAWFDAVCQLKFGKSNTWMVSESPQSACWPQPFWEPCGVLLCPSVRAAHFRYPSKKQADSWILMGMASSWTKHTSTEIPGSTRVLRVLENHPPFGHTPLWMKALSRSRCLQTVLMGRTRWDSLVGNWCSEREGQEMGLWRRFSFQTPSHKHENSRATRWMAVPPLQQEGEWLDL